MKILIFNWQDKKNPLSGGAEVHLHEIFSRVAKSGHEVTLFCSSFKGAKKEEFIEGIHVIREGGRYLFNFRVFYKYFTKFRHEKFDVVIDDMNKIPFFTPLFVREPLYFIVHHIFNKSIFLEVPWPIAFYVYLMEKLGLFIGRWKKIRVIVVSPSTKKELIQKGFEADNIKIIYNCVDHNQYQPDETKRNITPLIGYVGRIKKYKSIEHLIRAFAGLVRDNYNAELIIVGDGDNRLSLENLSKELGIAKNIGFTGFVDETTKVALIQKMWFEVNTSSKEGWGLTVIEANACKTPVIASNVPGLRDSVRDGETGILYEYGNINELTEKIKFLLDDSDLLTKLSNNAYAWSQKFKWENAAKDMIDILEAH